MIIKVFLKILKFIEFNFIVSYRPLKFPRFVQTNYSGHISLHTRLAKNYLYRQFCRYLNIISGQFQMTSYFYLRTSFLVISRVSQRNTFTELDDLPLRKGSCWSVINVFSYHYHKGKLVVYCIIKLP